MANKVFTAPLALIKVNNQVIGKMKTIRVTESVRRGKVMSLGNLVPEDLPPLEWNGTFSCSFYTIDIKNNPIVNALIRKAGSVENFVNTLLLGEDGIDVVIMRRIAKTKDPVTKLVTSDLEEFATIRSAFINRESFDISESNISGRDCEFEYLNPILFDI